MRMHWLACLVAVVGCKKEPAAPEVEAPAAPASTAEQDALWQLAPDGAQIGVVGSPRGLAMIERGAIDPVTHNPVITLTEPPPGAD